MIENQINILYISALEGGKYSGPLLSVPNQVKAQGKIDNVYWVNLTDIDIASLKYKNIYHYISIIDVLFNKSPILFCKPDIVIFEEYFKIECCLIARKCEKENIPYIIIPRCQMTKQYLVNKKWKKTIACLLLFYHFANKAKAIHFLTEQEKRDSDKFFSGKSFIVANGIDIPNIILEKTEQKEKIGVFIGRYSIWQKGLDILIEAIYIKHDVLKKNYIRFELYGPDERTGCIDKIKRLVDKYHVNDLVSVNGPVYGKDKEKILSYADFFVHTSRFEGMPMAVLEALSYGVPCLVTQGSNMRELVERAEAGWGSSTDIIGVADSFERICKDKLLFKRKSNNASELAMQYSWNRIAKECHEQYLQFIK